MQRRNFITQTSAMIPVLGLASVFDVQATSAQPSFSKAFVIRKGESRFGVPTPFRGINPNDLKISTQDSGGKLSIFDYFGNEKIGPSLHRHLRQDEVFYVVEGEYLFQVGDDKQHLSTGDLIFLPRLVPHTWVQLSEKGHLFYFLQPADKMEEFFVKMNEAKGQISQEESKGVYGIENVGNGLNASDAHVLSAHVQHGFVIRAHQSRFRETTLLNRLNPNDLKVSSSDTNGELSIFEYTGKEKGGPPLHIHLHQDEIFYVIQGDYLFQVGTDQYELHEGDTIFLPRGVPHAFAQKSAVGKMIFCFTPSGKMENFFRTLAQFNHVPSPEEGARVFEAHDMKVVGAPLSF